MRHYNEIYLQMINHQTHKQHPGIANFIDYSDSYVFTSCFSNKTQSLNSRQGFNSSSQGFFLMFPLFFTDQIIKSSICLIIMLHVFISTRRNWYPCILKKYIYILPYSILLDSALSFNLLVSLGKHFYGRSVVSN